MLLALACVLLEASLPSAAADDRDTPERLRSIRRQVVEFDHLARANLQKTQPPDLILRPAVNTIYNNETFEPVLARFVRFTVHATVEGGEPCLDELEVYAEGNKDNLARAPGARATASSLLPGHPIHQITHLNDGKYGNAHSWISNERGKGWAQIELPAAARLCRVVWSREADAAQYHDRLPTAYRVEVSADGMSWKQVASHEGRARRDAVLSREKLLEGLDPAQRRAYQELQTQLNRAAGVRMILTGHTEAVFAVRFSPDGQTLASAGMGGVIRLWDAATGQERALLQGHRGTIPSLAFSPDGKTLASVGYDQTLRLWDLSREEQRLSLQAHHHQVESVAFSPDGKSLASRSSDMTTKLWDVATTRQTASVSSQNYGVLGFYAVRFSPDGKTLANGCKDHTVELMNLAGGQRRALRGHTGPVEAVAFSPDGAVVASGSQDQTCRLWDLARGTLLSTLPGHGGSIGEVAFSPDGRTLASASADHTVKLWEVATGRERATLHGHMHIVYSVSFSPDGRTLASASYDRTVRLWDTDGASAGDGSPTSPTAADLLRWWEDLGSDDPARAHSAIRKLAESPRQAMPFLDERLRPPIDGEARRIKQLLANLDADEFATREKASAELKALGERVLPAFEGALESKPPLEVIRRLQDLLEAAGRSGSFFWKGEPLRRLRSLEALERIGTAEAQAVLRRLSSDPLGGRLNRQAQAALQRLANARKPPL